MTDCWLNIVFIYWPASVMDMGYYYTYLILLSISCLLGFWSRKPDPDLRIIMWLLLFSVITESIVYVLAIVLKLKPEYFAVYHIYVPLEYLLLSYFFSKKIDWKYSRSIFFLLAIVIIALNFWLTFFVGDPFSYPGKNLNVSGFFLIAWSSAALFFIKPQANKSIYSFPIFWISIGFLIYYSVSFFHNFIYGILFTSRVELAEALNDIINKGANDVLYICISIAFICSHQQTKSS